MNKKEGDYMKYYYVTNNKVIMEYLEKELERNVVYLDDGIINEESFKEVSTKCKEKPIFIMYEDKKTSNANKKYIIENKAKARYYTSAEGTYSYKTHNYIDIKSPEEYIEVLKEQIPIIENTLEGTGENAFDYSKGYFFICGNCHEKMKLTDKYCALCGAPKGEGIYTCYGEYNYSRGLFYGSPDVAKFQCPECGKIWFKTYYANENKSYCTKCGKLGKILKVKQTNLFSDMPNLKNRKAVEEWMDD